MNIYLILIICVSFTLAQEPPLPPQPTSLPSPTKHPFQQCLETYNKCVQEAGNEEWKPQQACLLAYYECQNAYTAECRELFRNKCCYNLLGKDECDKRLRACYGSRPSS